MIPQPALLVVVGASTVAGALHVYMFACESILFMRPGTLRMLEVEPRAADAVRLWAFHQGVYNLLLGMTGVSGAIALLYGAEVVGRALLWSSGTAMVIAAVALIVADRRRRRLPGFLAQAILPAVALAVLSVA